jgi:hypothetical protein
MVGVSNVHIRPRAEFPLCLQLTAMLTIRKAEGVGRMEGWCTGRGCVRLPKSRPYQPPSVERIISSVMCVLTSRLSAAGAWILRTLVACAVTEKSNSPDPEDCSQYLQAIVFVGA